MRDIKKVVLQKYHLGIVHVKMEYYSIMTNPNEYIVNAIITNKLNNKKYHRYVQDGTITWRDKYMIVNASLQVQLEKFYLEDMYKKAAEYAELSYPFDREEEIYYQNQKVKVYDAYIHGHIAGHTEFVKPAEIEIGNLTNP